MTSLQLTQAEEALIRARSGSSKNDYYCVMAFASRGIKVDDIDPRVNVLTYKAWRAVGRQVAKGAIGVQLAVWIPVETTTDDGKRVSDGVRPRTATVFHVSQTVPIGSDEKPAGADNPELFRQ